MRTQFSKLAMAAAFGLALAFTFSCSSEDKSDEGNENNGNGQGGSSNENLQIYHENGTAYKGNGIIKIFLDYDQSNQTFISINAGSVTNGIVRLELPQTISDEYLCLVEGCILNGFSPGWAIIDPALNEGCEVSSKDAKGFLTGEFELFDSDEKHIGTLANYYYDYGNQYFTAYSYFTKSTKITCDNSFKKFDINADVNWNKIYIKDIFDSEYCEYGIYAGKEECREIFSSSNFFTKEAKWTISLSYVPSSSSIASSSSSVLSSSSSVPSSSSSSRQSVIIPGNPVYHGGETYQTVVIGSQTWMARNLNYDPGTGNSRCYENDDNYCDTYGRLYDWATAMDIDEGYNYEYWGGSDARHRGICPSGWHIPSNKDWDKLYRYADGTSGTDSPYASPTAGRYLKARSGWNSGISNGNGEDTFGFAALPGGIGLNDYHLNDVGYLGSWWSASEYGADGAYDRVMGYTSGDAEWSDRYKKGYFFSVRCVKD